MARISLINSVELENYLKEVYGYETQITCNGYILYDKSNNNRWSTATVSGACMEEIDAVARMIHSCKTTKNSVDCLECYECESCVNCIDCTRCSYCSDQAELVDESGIRYTSSFAVEELDNAKIALDNFAKSSVLVGTGGNPKYA